MDKLKSRKMWAVIAGVASLAATALSGEAQWSEVAWPIAVLILGYLGVQGAVDYRAVGFVEPTPTTVGGIVTATQVEGGAEITVDIAEGVRLDVVAQEGQKPQFTLNGKPLDKLQFPKDFLGLLLPRK
jgi:hypothetical protein